MSDAKAIIERLALQPHPEGGWYRETWRADAPAGERAGVTAILFLLEQGQRSHWHKVDAAELWFWHAGATLRLEVADGDAGPVESVALGPDVLADEGAATADPSASVAGGGRRSRLDSGVLRGRPGVRVRRLHAGAAGLAAGALMECRPVPPPGGTDRQQGVRRARLAPACAVP